MGHQVTLFDIPNVSWLQHFLSIPFASVSERWLGGNSTSSNLSSMETQIQSLHSLLKTFTKSQMLWAYPVNDDLSCYFP